MKVLTKYKLFENLNSPIGIEEYLEKIGILASKKAQIIKWWNDNRSNIKIHYFAFSSPAPIAGVFLSEDDIAVNSKMQMPPHIKLFLSLHESRHCDHYAAGDFMSGYYDTVVAGNKPAFLEAYAKFEKDANDFAINGMIECGFSEEMSRESQMLRRNESAGEMVYKMMTDDIKKFRSSNFIDLLKKQIL